MHTDESVCSQSKEIAISSGQWRVSFHAQNRCKCICVGKLITSFQIRSRIHIHVRYGRHLNTRQAKLLPDDGRSNRTMPLHGVVVDLANIDTANVERQSPLR